MVSGEGSELEENEERGEDSEGDDGEDEDDEDDEDNDDEEDEGNAGNGSQDEGSAKFDLTVSCQRIGSTSTVGLSTFSPRAVLETSQSSSHESSRVGSKFQCACPALAPDDDTTSIEEFGDMSWSDEGMPAGLDINGYLK